MVDTALLIARLRQINSGDSAGESRPPLQGGPVGSSVSRLINQAPHHLAVYGSLAPGEENAWVLNGLTGAWRAGVVRGHLRRLGWGEALGYPGITWDPEGPDVAVVVFVSADLPQAWPRIDAFEGADYRRILVPVLTDDDLIVANIYDVVR